MLLIFTKNPNEQKQNKTDVHIQCFFPSMHDWAGKNQQKFYTEAKMHKHFFTLN